MKMLYKLFHTIGSTRFAVVLLIVMAVIGILGARFFSPTAYAACQPPATTYGVDILSVTVPTTTTYVVWARMQSPSSSADSIMLEVDGGSCYTVGGSTSMPANTWTWVNYLNGNTGSPLHIALNQGSHTFKFIGTNPNEAVDLILLLASTNNCVPTGTGGNCVPASSPSPPPSPTPSPPSHPSSPSPSGSGSTSSTSPSTGGSGTTTATLTTTPSGTTVTTSGGLNAQTASGNITEVRGALRVTAPITLSPTSTDGLSKVSYYLNGKLLATVSKTPFTYRLNTRHLLNGTYLLTIDEYLSGGAVRVIKQTLIVANPYSFMQFALALRKYIFSFWGILTILIIIGAVWFIRKRLRQASLNINKRPPPNSGDIRGQDMATVIRPPSPSRPVAPESTDSSLIPPQAAVRPTRRYTNRYPWR